MHELTVVQSLINTVNQYRQENENRQVKSLLVEVGALTCVDANRLQFCFDMLKADAGLEKALLHFQQIEAVARCNDCDNEFTVAKFGQPCQCGNYKQTLLSGKELNLTEIEFE